MKDKNDIPWYYWRFSAGATFLLFLLFIAIYGVIKERYQSFKWIDVPFGIFLLLLIGWLVKSEWKHRKPQHINPDKL